MSNYYIDAVDLLNDIDKMELQESHPLFEVMHKMLSAFRAVVGSQPRADVAPVDGGEVMTWHYPDDGEYPRTAFETPYFQTFSVDVVAVDKDGQAFIAYYSTIGEKDFWANSDNEEKISNIIKWGYLPKDYYEEFEDE